MSTQKNSTTTVSEKTYPNIFRFVDYKVYQDSKNWYQEVVSLKGVLETNTDLWFQLKSHITSMVMNIAAASTKLPSEAQRYLGSSITAANKAVACLDIACDFGVITTDEFDTLSDGFKGIIIQLKAFIKGIGIRSAKAAESKAEQVTA